MGAQSSAAPKANSAAPAAASGPSELSYSAGAALVIDLGMLPQTPAFGLQPWIALSVDRLRFAASFAWWVTGHAASDYPGAVLEGRGLAGGASLGFELVRTPFSLVPYAVAELAQLRVSTAGVSNPGSAAATWAAVGPGLHGEHGITDEIRVTLDASLLVPFRRPRWLLRTPQGDVAVLSASSATFRLSAGLAYVFP